MNRFEGKTVLWLPHAFDVLLLGEEDGRRSLADKARVIERI